MGNVGSIIQPGWAKGSVLDALDGGTWIDHGTGQQKSGLIYQLSLPETECPLKTRFGKTKWQLPFNFIENSQKSHSIA